MERGGWWWEGGNEGVPAPSYTSSLSQTVLLTVWQGLTIGIVEGGPCGRTGVGSCGDGGASWVLHLLLTAADHTTGTAPGYAPSCWHRYCSTSCWQVSNDSYGKMTPTPTPQYLTVCLTDSVMLTSHVGFLYWLGFGDFKRTKYCARIRRHNPREKCETSACVRFRGELWLLLSILKISAQCTRSLDATRNAQCFQFVCSSRTVCRSHQ